MSQIQEIIKYCQQRNPEALDQIFDSLPQNNPTQSQQVVNQIIAQLSDLDTLAWFCSYMASEINSSQDSDRPYLPIKELSKTLILLGMQPFVDFVPYHGRRIVILEPEKFSALPESVQSKLKQAFEFSVLLRRYRKGRSGEELFQINEAVRQELEVS